eukprot:5823017-Amphidinium_carterae.2
MATTAAAAAAAAAATTTTTTTTVGVATVVTQNSGKRDAGHLDTLATGMDFEDKVTVNNQHIDSGRAAMCQRQALARKAKVLETCPVLLVKCVQTRWCEVHQTHSPPNHWLNSVLPLAIKVQPAVVCAVELSTQL